MKARYGPQVKITDPGLLGPVLAASEHEKICIDQMIEEFELNDWMTIWHGRWPTG